MTGLCEHRSLQCSCNTLALRTQSRLPILLEPVVFDALLPALDQIVRMQEALLVDTVRGQLMTQHAILAMAPRRPSYEHLQLAYDALRDAIDPHGFHLVQLDSGCVVSDCDPDASDADGCRVEVSTNFAHALFERLTCAELVALRWDGDVCAAATLLNRREEALDDETLGVGAWYVRWEDGSLRYRILLPFTEQWRPPLDLFVSSLVARWIGIKQFGLRIPSDFGPSGDMRKLFSAMRSGDAHVLRV